MFWKCSRHKTGRQNQFFFSNILRSATQNDAGIKKNKQSVRQSMVQKWFDATISTKNTARHKMDAGNHKPRVQKVLANHAGLISTTFSFLHCNLTADDFARHKLSRHVCAASNKEKWPLEYRIVAGEAATTREMAFALAIGFAAATKHGCRLFDAIQNTSAFLSHVLHQVRRD